MSCSDGIALADDGLDLAASNGLMRPENGLSRLCRAAGVMNVHAPRSNYLKGLNYLATFWRTANP